jgi:NOL1/NOP2/fmu family ribosome biogenesis protein
MRPDKLKILNKKERKEILDLLENQFGIKKVNGIFLQRGAERIFIYQGSLEAHEITKLEETVPIERVGVYFGKFQNDMIRLSIDGVQLFQDQITKNIFELNEEQMQEWMMGRELNIETGKKAFLIMKYKDNFLGCGKASELKITNYIPKSRRLKEKG